MNAEERIEAAALAIWKRWVDDDDRLTAPEVAEVALDAAGVPELVARCAELEAALRLAGSILGLEAVMEQIIGTDDYEPWNRAVDSVRRVLAGESLPEGEKS